MGNAIVRIRMSRQRAFHFILNKPIVNAKAVSLPLVSLNLIHLEFNEDNPYPVYMWERKSSVYVGGVCHWRLLTKGEFKNAFEDLEST